MSRERWHSFLPPADRAELARPNAGAASNALVISQAVLNKSGARERFLFGIDGVIHSARRHLHLMAAQFRADGARGVTVDRDRHSPGADDPRRAAHRREKRAVSGSGRT